jgi:hypothetical protein
MDTKLELSHFGKQNRSRKAKSGTESLRSFGGKTNDRVLSSQPNVVVSHTEDGLEAVHLFNGHTLCQLKLQHGLNADINGDGVIENIRVVAGHHKG